MKKRAKKRMAKAHLRQRVWVVLSLTQLLPKPDATDIFGGAFRNRSGARGQVRKWAADNACTLEQVTNDIGYGETWNLLRDDGTLHWKVGIIPAWVRA